VVTVLVVEMVSGQAGARRAGDQVLGQGRCRCRLGRWLNLQVVMQSAVRVHASSGFVTIFLGIGRLQMQDCFALYYGFAVPPLVIRLLVRPSSATCMRVDPLFFVNKSRVL
jgi:hypothetical protein